MNILKEIWKETVGKNGRLIGAVACVFTLFERDNLDFCGRKILHNLSSSSRIVLEKCQTPCSSAHNFTNQHLSRVHTG